MKKIIFITLLTFILFSLWADQDSNNRKYLILLDENLISTIEMLDAFHKRSENIYEDIEHGQDYDQFLLTMTMECSNLLENIRNADGLDVLGREEQIAGLIATIKPDVNYPEKEISDITDNENSVYLSDIQVNLRSQKTTLLKHLLAEEEKILENGKITENYMRLHSHNFLFSLILNFTKDADYLSKSNRAFLVGIAKSIDESLVRN